jgi:hypothetical protein
MSDLPRMADTVEKALHKVGRYVAPKDGDQLGTWTLNEGDHWELAEWILALHQKEGTP